MIDAAQKQAALFGDLFEIGAHHGKSTVMLGQMADRGETVEVCDIFGSQTLNASASGAGDRAIMERNMGRLAPGQPLRIHECMSSELTADALGRYRFFHVDGGHLVEEALGDIRLGGEVLDDRGVVVVDDPFRIEWPGVTEAILAFLADTEWVPVALGFNKIVLCRRHALPVYSTVVDGDKAWSYIDARMYERKHLPIAGTDTPIFYVPTYRQIAGLPVAAARARWFQGAIERMVRR